MKRVPAFHVKLEGKTERKTLADVPEWTLAECDFSHNLHSIMRFRVGDFAYGTDRKGYIPTKQAPANQYTVKRVIGQIVCD